MNSTVFKYLSKFNKYLYVIILRPDNNTLDILEHAGVLKDVTGCNWM